MQTSRLPSILASVVLHLGLFLAAYITWPLWSKKIEMSAAVPITIVSQAPVADVRPAEKAPEVQTAAAPEPEPTPQPAPPAPEPAPEPKPAPKPAPAPKPTPVPKPTPPAPVPKPEPKPLPKPAPKPTPEAKAKPEELNLDQLASAKTKPPKAASAGALDLTALATTPKGARSNAPKGPARAETDFMARLAAGHATALSADAMSALQSKLNRLWNPNCEVEGGANVQVRVEVKLSPGGLLVGKPILVSQAGSSVGGSVVEASAQRALSAVKQGEPYTEIPKDGPHDIILHFNAKQACQR